MKELLKNHKIPIILLVSCCAFYLSFAYDLEREDFIRLLTLYGAVFFLSWKFFQMEKTNIRFLLGAAVLFRLIFLFSIPNLSQDFYRFIWDGNLLIEGMNPYLFTPNEILNWGDLPFDNARELYSGMGSLSAGNHTNYPPINQVFFAISSFLSGNSILGAVVVMKIIIISADLGIFYFGRKLLHRLKLPENRVFWYLLNPFIIIELTGNLHFEGVLLFFLVWSLYLLHLKKWILSAVVFACSVSVKLIPLLFLPLLFRNLGLKKSLIYYGIVGAVNFLLFLPFLNGEFLENYLQTTGLWFQKFEFNAGVYYIIRWIGYELKGYNVLFYVGKLLAGTIFIVVMALALLKRNRSTTGLISAMVFAITAYYLLSTTVHPWYLAVPVALCIFTNYRFPLLWSLLIVLSYEAYSSPTYEENLWLIGIEYVAVFTAFGFELYQNEIKKKPSLKERRLYNNAP